MKRFFVTLTALLTIQCATAYGATPPPAPVDPVTATFYAPDPRIDATAVALVNSATNNINLASNAFSDKALTAALCLASSRGVHVAAVLNVSTGTAATIPYRQLIASGGSVWIASFPPKLANNIFTIDSGTCGTGTYQWSGPAVQVGDWWAIVAGTATTAGFNATFGSLQTSGTRQTTFVTPRSRPYNTSSQTVLINNKPWEVQMNRKRQTLNRETETPPRICTECHAVIAPSRRKDLVVCGTTCRQRKHRRLARKPATQRKPPVTVRKNRRRTTHAHR
jgi:hypothetical protein